MEELAITEELDIEAAKALEAVKAPPQKKTSFKKDAVFTSMAQLGVAFTSIFQYYLIRRFWPNVDDFAAYSQLFRVRTYVESLVLLVLTIALPAQIPALRALNDPKGAGVRTWSGLALAFVLMSLTVAIARMFPESAALVFFGNKNLANWIPAFCNLLFGYAFASVIFSCLRGYMRFLQANVLAFFFGGITPLACPILLRGHPLQDVVSYCGMAAWGIGLVFLILLAKEEEGMLPSLDGFGRFWSAVKELVGYGAPRIVTVACTAVFTLLLPWWASHRNDPHLVASINAILLILVGSTIFVSGLGFVLLPRFSALFAQGHTTEARRQLGLLLEFTIFVGGLGALLAIGLLKTFLVLWVGSRIEFVPILLGSAGLAIPMVLILEIFRAPIDAASKVPWNAVTYGVGALTSMAVIKIFGMLDVPLATTLAVALVSSYYTAAIVSITIAHRLYGFELGLRKAAAPLLVLVACLAVLLKERYSVPELVLIVSSLLAGAAYTGVWLLGKPSWVNEIVPKRFRRA